MGSDIIDTNAYKYVMVITESISERYDVWPKFDLHEYTENVIYADFKNKTWEEKC